MGWNTVQGDWQRHMGQVRILWSKLTEEELQEINGRREKLVDKIHERYHIPQDAAEEQVRVFESRFDDINPHLAEEVKGMQEKSLAQARNWALTPAHNVGISQC